MNKLLIVLISAVLALTAVSFAACSKNDGDESEKDADTLVTTAKTDDTDIDITTAYGDNVFDFNDFGDTTAGTEQSTETSTETDKATDITAEITAKADSTTTKNEVTTPVETKPTKPETTETTNTEKVTFEETTEEITTSPGVETDEREGWTTGWY